MNAEDRRKLLEQFAELATDGGADAARSPNLFLPLPQHRLALRPETVVIEGARGAGKTALFNLVTGLGAKPRELYDDRAIPEARWVDAFSGAIEHPQAAVLDGLSGSFERDASLRAFWMAHLLGRLTDAEIPGASLPEALARERKGQEANPAAWVSWCEANAGLVMNGLDAIERALAAKKATVFATYDALDRIGDLDRAHRQRQVRALLSLWLSLSDRYRQLRAKVFLRHDLFEEAEHGFADASKLRPRSVALDWNVESLFRLVVRHLANAGRYSKVAREWLDGIEGLRLEDRGAFGWMPGEMGEEVRKAFAVELAGEVMGAGAKKGYTHKWIPDRLRDADGRIVPRSILRLLSEAAKHALLAPRGTGPLMNPTDLTAALVETSKQRSNELAEEYAVVARLENLRGRTMLMARGEVIAALGRPTLRDKLTMDGEGVFDELRRTGVLEVRRDGRIDVPDIYRYGYGIKRKGGARRLK